MTERVSTTTELPGTKKLLAEVLFCHRPDKEKLIAEMVQNPTNGKAGGDLFANRSKQRGGKFLGPGRYSVFNRLEAPYAD